MTLERRSIGWTYVFIIITLGIYYYYFLYKTKEEMNEEFKGSIPTFWLIIIPIANIYWLFKYAECFSLKVRGKGGDDVALSFIIIWFLGALVTPWYVQSELNKFIDDPSLFEKRRLDHRIRYCPKCGRQIPFDANVCPYCGKQFETYF